MSPSLKAFFAVVAFCVVGAIADNGCGTCLTSSTPVVTYPTGTSANIALTGAGCPTSCPIILSYDVDWCVTKSAHVTNGVQLSSHPFSEVFPLTAGVTNILLQDTFSSTVTLGSGQAVFTDADGHELRVTTKVPVCTLDPPTGSADAGSTGSTGASTGTTGAPAGCVSICDDPHFLGLNGVRYNFQGEPDKTFALVADANVQLNSRFISHVFQGEHRTNLGATCLRTCSANVTMLPNGELHVNGKRLYWHDEEEYRVHHYRDATVTYLAKRVIEVEIPGKWLFELHANGAYINVNHVVPLSPAAGVHGVLGHTYGAPVKPHHTKCNSYQEGGCAVEGAFQDYEVDGDDLCSAEWKYQRFQC